MEINAFKCWKWQLKWYNYMIRSYSFQNPRAFPMACATFETTAQKPLGTLACRDIWWSSFRWNASLSQSLGIQASKISKLPNDTTGLKLSTCAFRLPVRSIGCAPEVTKGQNYVFWKCFLSITSPLHKLGELFWHHCVPLVKPDRLICLFVFYHERSIEYHTTKIRCFPFVEFLYECKKLAAYAEDLPTAICLHMETLKKYGLKVSIFVLTIRKSQYIQEK